MSVDPFIEAEEVAGHSVVNACHLLEVSRAAYYQRKKAIPSARAVTDAELTERINAIHSESKGTYGSPRVHRALRKQGIGCGKRRVRRLMHQAGLEGRCKKRWRKTTVADPDAEQALDLIQRHFGPGAEVDRRYVGDITYLPTWEGWAYLATVIDLSSRRVVGWALADHMRTELVSDALTMAFRNRSPEEGLIFHSDRGCQYTSADYGQLARENGVVLSVGRKGECWDNAVAESFFATIKRELIDTRAWPTRAGLHRAVFDYIEGWYNVRRLHSSLDYFSPAEWETIHRNADRQAA
jgi:transposase InsO family protein